MGKQLGVESLRVGDQEDLPEVAGNRPIRTAKQIDERQCPISVKTREWLIKEQEARNGADFPGQGCDGKSQTQGKRELVLGASGEE